MASYACLSTPHALLTTQGRSLGTPPRVLSSASRGICMVRSTRLANGNRSRRALSVTAGKGPFGWLENNKDVEGRDEQWEIQQEMLRARRGGKAIDENVTERRKKVSKYMNNTMDAEEKAEIDAKNREAAAALSKEAVKGGIPLPMASFGMPEFDGGERFDLRGPYVEEGWVDEEEQGEGPFSGLRKLFGLGGNKNKVVEEEEDEEGNGKKGRK